MDTRGGGKAIPVMFGIDAVHGHNNIVGATMFPHNIGLGATRDPDLMRRIGEATALRDARHRHRLGVRARPSPWRSDDRWGRTYEGYSEWTRVVASYAGAMVEGLQGKVGTPAFLDGRHVIASAKHFLGDGGTIDGKDQGDTADQRGRAGAHRTLPAIRAAIARRRADGDGVLLQLATAYKMHGNTPADRRAEGPDGLRRLRGRRLERPRPGRRAAPTTDCPASDQCRPRHVHGARRLEGLLRQHAGRR